MNEQLRMLDHSSDDFIDRYNFYTSLLIVAALNPTRHTLFLFPGGMASKLKRANKAWQAAGPASQVFTYEELWVNALTLLGGKASDLSMSKTAGGEYRDKGNRMIIADGVVNLFGVTPYLGFTATPRRHCAMPLRSPRRFTAMAVSSIGGPRASNSDGPGDIFKKRIIKRSPTLPDTF